jgi:hypothetical protein
MWEIPVWRILDMGRTIKGLIVIFVISCFFSTQFSFAKPVGTEKALKEAETNLLANKSPAQLIEFWDDASHAERVIIQNKLIDDIPTAIPILQNKILTGTQKQKLFACTMIAEIRDTNSVPILLKAIDDPDDKVKTRAISSLGILKANQAADKIRQEMSVTKNKGVLKASLAALGTLGRPQDIAVLKTYLSDSDESVRVNAAAAMALLGNYDGQNILIAGTQSSSPGVKKEATYSLGFLNTPEAKTRLEEIINDPNSQWKSYAEIALVQQQLLNKPLAQQLLNLETAANDKNQRVAEWAVEKIADMDVPQGNTILQKVGKNKTEAGMRTSRLLKIKGAK